MTGDITQLLRSVAAGDAGAFDRLYELAYDELRQIARRQRWRHPAGGTLQTTALVHEAYVKLFDASTLDPQDRAHFFALAARAMRQVLIDHFRGAQADKRGGAAVRVELAEHDVPVEQRGAVLLALDEALGRLERLDPRLARVVECRFFGGMTQDEIAAALGVTDRTVRNDWRKAKAFLARELADSR